MDKTYRDLEGEEFAQAASELYEFVRETMKLQPAPACVTLCSVLARILIEQANSIEARDESVRLAKWLIETKVAQAHLL